MKNGLLIAIIAGLGGMFGWGFSEFATKKSVDKIGAISSLVWAHVFGTFILAGVLLARLFVTKETLVLPHTANGWLGVVFFGTLQATVYYFAYKGFELGEVSLLSPIFASFAGLVALGSVIIFGETISFRVGCSLAMIFAGVLLINLDPQDLRAKRIRLKGIPGLKEIVIAALLATTWTLGWDKFVATRDWMVTTTLMFLFMSGAAVGIAIFARARLLEVTKGAWRYLWFIALGEVAAYLAITLGYATTSHASVVAVLSGASSLVTIGLAHFFLREKVARIQAIGSSVIILGIILVSLS